MKRFVHRIQNPRGRECGCRPVCWCKRTRLGRALRWYFPKSHMSVEPEWKAAKDRR